MGSEGLRVAERLRLLQRRERVARAGDFCVRFIVVGHDECEHGVRPTLVILARRVEVARTDTERARDVDAFVRMPSRISPITLPRHSLAAGKYDRKAT